MRSVRALDNISFTDWFKSHGGSEASIRRMWDPIAYALGFLNCDDVGGPSARSRACWQLAACMRPHRRSLAVGDVPPLAPTRRPSALHGPRLAALTLRRLKPCHRELSVSHSTAAPSLLSSAGSLQISARCMLSIFQFFATKTDASVLRMLNGSPAERLLQPIAEYVQSKGGRVHTQWGCR